MRGGPCLGVASIKAQSVRVRKDVPYCRSCGRRAANLRIMPIRGECGKLGMWCRCGRCLGRIRLHGVLRVAVLGVMTEGER